MALAPTDYCSLKEFYFNNIALAITYFPYRNDPGYPHDYCKNPQKNKLYCIFGRETGIYCSNKGSQKKYE